MLQNVPLSAYSTMRLGGNAAFLTDINDMKEIPQAVTWAQENQLPIIMIGGGSNIVWQDAGFPGLVMVNKIQGVETQSPTETDRYITVGAGVIWDEFVRDCVDQGLSGIEFLSLVPGTVGATPIQNVGAYGQEVSSTIITLQAYDVQTQQFVTIPGSECAFGYRTSRFKTSDRGRYLIVNITFQLRVGNPEPPYYAAAQKYFDDHNLDVITPQIARKATIAIRNTKLPDPALVANNGSFFANPIISSEQFFQLKASFQDIPQWSVDDTHVKISAAWLLEQAGFKDYHDPETGMGTWPAQPLVLVNESATSTAQLLQFKQHILDTVAQKFGITLTQEPELLPIA